MTPFRYENRMMIIHCTRFCGRCGIRTHGTFTSYSLANCCNNHSANLPRYRSDYFTSFAHKHGNSFIGNCGRGRIRTHGTLTSSSFQDCHHKPLGHSSISEWLKFWLDSNQSSPFLAGSITTMLRNSNHSVLQHFVVTVGLEPTLSCDPMYQTSD